MGGISLRQLPPSANPFSKCPFKLQKWDLKAFKNRRLKGCFKAFSPKRGLVFAVKGASPLPPPPPALAPLFSWVAVEVVLKIPERGGLPGGGGGPVSTGNLGGGAEAPFTVKMSPLFGENAFLAHWNRSDFCDWRLRCPSRTPESQRFPSQEKAMLHCDI